MTATCTVVIAAPDVACGAPAVHVRESIFGGEVAECAEHHIVVAGRSERESESMIGFKVEIHWHSWAKRGEIVEEDAGKFVVRFVPRKGAAAIERRFKAQDVKFVV